MQFSSKKKFRLNGVQILALGFLIVIIIGAIILSLPISSRTGEPTNFLDAIFTSTSAVCVTGLITLDTSTHWSVFGQTVIITLIEIGGLGFMSFGVLISLILGKKITLRERLVMQEAMNTYSIQGLVKMVKYVLIFTMSVQFFGALLLSTQFVPEYGIGRGIFYSIFHSISAFCNAGFDLFGTSLVGYSSNSVVILVISALIIIGGLGFTVLLEIYEFKGMKKLSLHSKLVLITTAILVFGGAILMLIFEYNNVDTIANMNIKDKLLNSFFASVTPRTAGFNSISTSGMTLASKFLTIILMFIGGSPGSTAGGLKTVTFGILVLTVICVIKGREDTEVFGRRFTKEIVYKSFTLLFIGVSLVIFSTMILSYTEVGVSFIDLLYETTSAFGTVGITLGLTPNLSSIGKVLIMLMMYFGRVGPLTVMLALTRKRKKSGYKYPEGKILIG
ncbi:MULTISPECIES: TrkH family potassium uptake protein [Clostridium]|jgi:trk system potassium uptake protein TrkH|uniref:TrkH family potassium uptake protein n=2 Tax=Clostridium tertium TaxID=1559 RepID=A0A9X4B3M6_9CLOT|nr:MULTISPECIES: TrkH family potassium uptake protein [Clostridium]EEH97613.1 TrkH family potassium uptake protein [Clostridium sp. 7_2_43FAA]MBP1868487.1 trk system potassium uptake protein TrkH [Clostridium tertium]MBS5306397.1 TrkH family potassium uptake protein [Clostridium sp.]MBS6501664.1 TrkH family potassium uptake protein [Clostridium sp.]MBU6135114.1 TrkH family potassium uptake protein [Clostridium tertium]